MSNGNKCELKMPPEDYISGGFFYLQLGRVSLAKKLNFDRKVNNFVRLQTARHLRQPSKGALLSMRVR